jgi:hypothetical protein
MRMKTIYTLFALAFAAAPLVAQINSTDLPMVGDSHFYTACDTTGITSGNAGQGQVWNYSNLSPNGSSYTINYNAPTGHPQAANYPAATLVEAYTNQQYRFLAGTADSVVLEGEKSVANTPVLYDNKATLYIFPMAFGYLHSDSVHGSYYDGFFSTVDRLGEYTVEVDGEGSLTTPFGTFPNVTRIKTIGVHFDSSWTGAADANVVTARYEWFATGTRTPLLFMTFTQVTINGGAPQLGRDVWFADNGVGIEAPLSSLKATIAPSVVDSRAQLSYTLLDAADVKVEIMNSVGVKVAQLNPGFQNNGVHSIDLDLGHLAAGMYMVRVDAGQESQLKKFMVR